jgi:hypothetical protein
MRRLPVVLFLAAFVAALACSGSGSLTGPTDTSTQAILTGGQEPGSNNGMGLPGQEPGSNNGTGRVLLSGGQEPGSNGMGLPGQEPGSNNGTGRVTLK